LRSRGIGYVLGVQGDDQGRALYGREVWQAIQKTCRHKVYFLGALDPRDALEISKTLGEMTVFEQTVIESGGESGNRSGTTTREAKRSLVSMEEMLSWERFHAVVIARNLAPFRVMCYPLFDPRHPEHGLHKRITEIAAQLPAPKNSSGQPTISNASLEPSVSTAPVSEPFEIARLIFKAVNEIWPCELLRERGKIIAVRLKPRAPFSPANISSLTWDGTILELRGLEHVTEEFINALVWLRRRTELEVWLTTRNAQIKGRPGYAGQPLGELEGEVLWLQASAVAEVFGRGYLQKKTIVKRTVDATELEVIAVKLQHGGLEKLRVRIKTLEAGQA
jgi:hypothetical protein